MSEGATPTNGDTPATRPGRKPGATRAAPLKPGATAAAPAATPVAARKPRGTARAKVDGAASKIRSEAGVLKGQATSRARDYATQGKERAAYALDNVARLITDAAGTVDDKVGAQYGDYTRKAAEAVSGFSTSLKGKDVEELVREATDLVKKSPAVAIGAAAAIGFVLARLVKAGADDKA
jgi:ElaB/YqjD/DUF883 family membrane-anchored ribosome-binding protein